MARIVNLCFHGIGAPARDLETGEAPYWIGSETYDAVLDLVADRDDVCLSFDDGNASDVEIGLPALLERGLTATFFVLAGRLDRPGSLASDDVRSLVSAGMSVGSHGMNHVPWKGLDDTALDQELVAARDRLAEVAAVPISSAALPLGRYDRRVLRRLAELGYTGVYSSDRLQARRGSWLQPRFSLRSHDTVETVASQMLAPSSVRTRVRGGVVGMVKRWR